MDKKYTLWNKPSESWTGMPKGLKVTEDLENKIKKTMRTPAPVESIRPYNTPIDQEQMAKIIG